MREFELFVLRGGNGEEIYVLDVEYPQIPKVGLRFDLLVRNSKPTDIASTNNTPLVWDEAKTLYPEEEMLNILGPKIADKLYMLEFDNYAVGLLSPYIDSLERMLIADFLTLDNAKNTEMRWRIRRLLIDIYGEDFVKKFASEHPIINIQVLIDNYSEIMSGGVGLEHGLFEMYSSRLFWLKKLQDSGVEVLECPRELLPEA